ncbi:hypothetical protein OG698_45465 [Streptomyces sp. NBC_01003]|uniref:hypothetical protein n=1 Tax=Streptomyces sp. NBC_01003 TaxID=2903714 RepID=UPI0038659C8C|nr:hypothetical protein OG698_45465 [Streptomyces sp. NBC_01003]
MVIPDLSQEPGRELSAEPGEAQQDLGVRVLRKRFIHRLGEAVGSGAGGFEVEEKGEHLFAKRFLEHLRLVCPVDAEGFA